MAGLVLDSSLVAAWCFPDERTDYTAAILRIISSPIDAFAPRLLAYEVRNSVLMGVRRNRITMTDAQELFTLLKALPIRLRDPQAYDQIFALADRYSLTVYDAAYLDLAPHESLPLASLDKALRNAALQSGVAFRALIPASVPIRTPPPRTPAGRTTTPA